MKRLNLDETWVLCLAMWKWIVKKVKAGSKKDIQFLKAEWCNKNDFHNMVYEDCFFCEYKSQRKIEKRDCCRLCPARRIDTYFNCHNDEYHYYVYPIAFYKKLYALNKIRLAKKGAKNV